MSASLALPAPHAALTAIICTRCLSIATCMSLMLLAAAFLRRPVVRCSDGHMHAKWRSQSTTAILLTRVSYAGVASFRVQRCAHCMFLLARHAVAPLSQRSTCLPCGAALPAHLLHLLRPTRRRCAQADRHRREVAFWKHELEVSVLEKAEWKERHKRALYENEILRLEVHRHMAAAQVARAVAVQLQVQVWSDALRAAATALLPRGAKPSSAELARLSPGCPTAGAAALCPGPRHAVMKRAGAKRRAAAARLSGASICSDSGSLVFRGAGGRSNVVRSAPLAAPQARETGRMGEGYYDASCDARCDANNATGAIAVPGPAEVQPLRALPGLLAGGARASHPAAVRDRVSTADSGDGSEDPNNEARTQGLAPIDRIPIVCAALSLMAGDTHCGSCSACY